MESTFVPCRIKHRDCGRRRRRFFNLVFGQEATQATLLALLRGPAVKPITLMGESCWGFSLETICADT